MKPSKKVSQDIEPDYRLYAGRWVARLGERIIGQGGTPDQARHAAKSMFFKETPLVSYVPTSQPLDFSDVIAQVAAGLSPETTVYVVGGAVRDALLGIQAEDIDLMLKGDVIRLARQVADRLGAAFYVMDPERQTARLILSEPDNRPRILDFAAMRGPDLESDLRARDFTINAMAVEIRHPQRLMDPLGGASDLRARLLRACSSSTFVDDPVRILRAVRFAANYDLHILPEARLSMHQAVIELERVSAERVRDELFRILSGKSPATSLRALDLLRVIEQILPELSNLKDVVQSPPHVSDVWDHSLDTVRILEELLKTLTMPHDPEKTTSLVKGEVSLLLGRYRQQFKAHLEARLNPDRSMRSLLLMVALYHDVGKPETFQLDEDGQIRFFRHEQVGAQIISERARNLKLSSNEAERMGLVVRHHLRPFLLAQTRKAPSRLAIHRFFRDTGEAGIDVCLLSLADVLATYGPTLTPDYLANHLQVVRRLLEAWYETPEESVSPPVLVTGGDLIDELHLEPGPLIGQLLTEIREAQAAGEISSREQAVQFAQSLVKKYSE